MKDRKTETMERNKGTKETQREIPTGRENR
jgi:hypothetical protein